MNINHKKNLELLKQDVQRKNKIRDLYKKERLRNITLPQQILLSYMQVMGRELGFKVSKEREIYTKDGVRFVDIFIQKFGLAIEVDGGYHSTPEQKNKDLLRSKEIWIKKKIIILRLTNDQILKNKENVIQVVKSTIMKLAKLPNWKSQGKGVKKFNSTIARRKLFNELNNL